MDVLVFSDYRQEDPYTEDRFGCYQVLLQRMEHLLERRRLPVLSRVRVQKFAREYIVASECGPEETHSRRAASASRSPLPYSYIS